MALEDALASMQNAIQQAVLPALTEAGRTVAGYAKDNHEYRNRTGRLEANTRLDTVVGSFVTGYTIRVEGATPYGSYVERGTSRMSARPFLAPAWRAKGDNVASQVATALAVAADRSP